MRHVALLLPPQKAEATLKSWDALLQRERNERHFLLQQRVEIQRRLITKKDQLSHELRTKHDDKQQEVCGNWKLMRHGIEVIFGLTLFGSSVGNKI